ncbi:hypothetical protein ACFLT1_01860 [Bacteroidota bacterium]
MVFRNYLIAVVLMLITSGAFAQSSNLAYLFTGVVYDANYRPLPYTHVIASGTGQGDMTDTLGIFTLYIRASDKLSIFNITCHDTVVPVNKDMEYFSIHLRRKAYPLKEAKIFSWGSTYEEFMEAVKNTEVEDIGEEMKLPQQDPDAIPFELDEKMIKSPRFFFSSPLSYLYYNLSEREKNVRKAYQLEKNASKIARFEYFLSGQKISEITGLEGKELQDFQLYLNQHIRCDFNCSELEILSEIYMHWEAYNN